MLSACPLTVSDISDLASVIVAVLISCLGFFVAWRIEKFKTELIRNEKKEKVAELFGWMPSIDGGYFPTPQENQKINQLMMEVTLYLPYDLSCKISECLAGKKDLDYKDVFIEVRDYILKNKKMKPDKLKGENLLHMDYRDPAKG